MSSMCAITSSTDKVTSVLILDGGCNHRHQHSRNESANIHGTERSHPDPTLHMTTTQATAVSVRDPWSLVPPLGNLDAYISAINRLPLLTQEEETRLATPLRDTGDLKA